MLLVKYRNKMRLKLDATYWENRYLENTSRWDLGEVSPPIKVLVDSLKDTSLRILIPGGGNSWEAEYLHRKGFTNVLVVDIASSPLKNLADRVPDFPKDHIIQEDFFDLSGSFDLIIEQTFFCAIHPTLRKDYVEKVHQLLRKMGKLSGLLFDAPLNEDRPPFGGNQKQYTVLFSPFFEINRIEKTKKSIESRSGRELFFEMTKK